MPEIWLHYGATDVVLDIRFENLSSQVSSPLQPMAEEQVKSTIDSVPLTDNMLVLVLSSSKAAAKTINAISAAARGRNFSGLTVDVPANIAGALRTNLPQGPQAEPVSINRIDYLSLQERLTKFQSAVIVSQVGVDPLFGFSGAPTSLLRALYPAKMSEAFSARNGNIPSPGQEAEPLKIATSATAGIAATSIELVANNAGIAGVHAGSIVEAFEKAKLQLRSLAVVEVDRARTVFVSASGEAGPHLTLDGSLNSLWNAAHIARDGGTVVLLAENREGLGGGALQAFAEGRLKPEQLLQPPYSEGLEHLLYMQELKQKIELGIVSSLPHYYAKKFGLTTFSGAKDALEKMLAKHGKGHKALVVSDADITLLKIRV